MSESIVMTVEQYEELKAAEQSSGQALAQHEQAVDEYLRFFELTCEFVSACQLESAFVAYAQRRVDADTVYCICDKLAEMGWKDADE